MARVEDVQPVPKDAGLTRAYRGAALRMVLVVALSVLVAIFVTMIPLHDVVESTGPAAEVACRCANSSAAHTPRAVRNDLPALHQARPGADRGQPSAGTGAGG